METASFLSPKNRYEERKWLLAVTPFEVTNSVYNTHENNTYSISTPGHWSSRAGAETINKLQNY